MKSILTLTLNPCIDMSSEINEVIPEEKLRCADPKFDPGGGGINVSRVIRKLGGYSYAMYCSGGPQASLLEDLLDRDCVERKTIKIEGWTRQNITFFETKSRQQFRFNMPGPNLLKSEGQECIDLIMGLMPAPDYVVISGSTPSGFVSSFMSQLARHFKETGTRLVVDTSGDSLKAFIEFGTYLIKPNLKEFSDILKKDEIPDHELEACCKEFMDKGYCEVLLLSLGEKGSILATSKDIKRISGPEVTSKSKIGAGDSMVGGVVFGLANNYSLYDSVVLGVAAGTSAVMSEGTQLCVEKDVWKFYEQIKEIHLEN
jgi:6-phosphofructokinase 2